jgi:hypothetical protein
MIRRLPQGISEYVSVVFDEQYFSSMQVVVQATLLDYRFRLKTFKSVKDELASYTERGIAVKSENMSDKKSFK